MEKRKKVFLAQESPAAENVFWVQIVLIFFLYHLLKATVGKKPQARWIPGLVYHFIKLLSFR